MNNTTAECLKEILKEQFVTLKKGSEVTWDVLVIKDIESFGHALERWLDKASKEARKGPHA